MSDNARCTRLRPLPAACCAAEFGRIAMNTDGTCVGCGHAAHACTKCGLSIFDGDWPHHHTAIECNDRLVARVRELEQEVAGLKEDEARLDWLLAHENTGWMDSIGSAKAVVWPDSRDDPDGSDAEYFGGTLREAIDAARAADSP